MTHPKISIVIPVYNVEKYLRQCLDSVVNQTMRDIQIICVNDGSPDHSRTILQEYADRDSRIEIIDKPNGGLSSARNAAYPSVRGKYTMFVDSDDWIHEETCRRTFDLAEKYHTDLCSYRLTRYRYKCRETRCQQDSLDNNIHFYFGLSVAEKCLEKLFTRNVTACSKLIRSDFLREYGFTFPQGVVFEDMPFHWNVIRAAKRILYTEDELYYHRQRPSSITASRGRHHLDVIAVYDIIRHDLEKAGCYEDCRQLFLHDKLAAFRGRYREIGPWLRREMRKRILESLTENDWEYIRDDPLMCKRHRKFYLELKNDSFSLENLGWLAFAEFWRACECCILWPAKRLLEFDWLAKKDS